jgi:RND family efflux transporter MFP subunit
MKMKTMKYLAPIIMLFFFACQHTEETLPEDLASLNTLQRETKTQIRHLESRLNEIDQAIFELDPEANKKALKIVTTHAVQRGDFERFIELQGAVEADETVYLSSETGGRLKNVFIKEGDYVKKGTLVAKVDLETLNKQKEEVKTRLDLAKQVFERQERLWNQNIGTEIQYLQAKNNVESLEKSIETIDHQMTKANVYAPISGEIDMLIKRTGETAGPAEPIASMLNTHRMKVAIDLPENLIKRIRRGDLVTVKIPAVDYENKHRVKRMGTSVNPTNRTIAVEVELLNGQGTVKPNLLATMLVKDYEEKDVILIPSNLLQQDVSGKYYVYTLEAGTEGHFAKKRFVETGESFDQKLIIKDGLEEGQLLIDLGSRSLVDGEPVELRKEQSTDAQ